MVKKKCYFVQRVDDILGYAVVVKDSKEAKKLALSIIDDADFIDIRVNWKRNVDVQSYPLGYVFEGVERLIEGLRIGAYSFLDEIPCPKCGIESYLETYNGEVLCEMCIDKKMECELNGKN